VRVAAVDLGTNTTRLLVADVVDGRVEELHRESRITRLGEGVDKRGRLLPLPIARVRNVLADYRRTLELLGAERTLAAATSAVRDAENGEAFLGEVEWSYGFVTQLLSGDEEAELTRRGVDPPSGTLVLDIGGGSTELVLDDFHVSLPMGSVRFTERYGDELPSLIREATVLLPNLSPEHAIGVAGTVTQLAAFDTENVHGYELSRARAREQLERLAGMSVAERRGLPRMEPERAPVIVAGAAILVAVLDAYALDAIEVSEHDLLDGVALVAAELPEPVEGDAPPGAYTCC
jgi:exopolyphosphatase / guanosine-5'-triphosphate,3'-diphosphate pyrophosphatase